MARTLAEVDSVEMSFKFYPEWATGNKKGIFLLMHWGAVGDDTSGEKA
jgi:hypothetical protein